MANTHQHLDLTTLQEVERLLTTTEFATIDEVARRSSAGSIGPLPAMSSPGPRGRSRDASEIETGGGTLLPKRR